MSLGITTLRVETEILSDVAKLSKELKIDRSDLLREAIRLGIREFKVRLALDLYSKGKVSFGRASEIAGIGYRELQLELKNRNVTFRYGEERFQEELRELGLA